MLRHAHTFWLPAESRHAAQVFLRYVLPLLALKCSSGLIRRQRAQARIATGKRRSLPKGDLFGSVISAHSLSRTGRRWLLSCGYEYQAGLLDEFCDSAATRAHTRHSASLRSLLDR